MHPNLKDGIKAHWRLAPLASALFALAVIVQMLATWVVPMQALAQVGFGLALASGLHLLWRRRDIYTLALHQVQLRQGQATAS